MDSTHMNEARPTRRPDWLWIVILTLLVINVLPFLAPVFARLGWGQAARAIYLLYAPLCHQMAQRSFFLFGPEGFQMYNLADLPIPGIVEMNIGQKLQMLRAFVGSESLGWKVAWSDRMVYMYGSMLLFSVLYAFIRRRQIRPLPLWAVVLLMLPMALDGTTHWISDLDGIGQGFRYTNAWLANLTAHALPASFYSGDAIGSFNSLARLVSGLTFGLAVCGLAFPYLDSLARMAPSRQLPTAVHEGWEL